MWIEPETVDPNLQTDTRVAQKELFFSCFWLDLPRKVSEASSVRDKYNVITTLYRCIMLYVSPLAVFGVRDDCGK